MPRVASRLLVAVMAGLLGLGLVGVTPPAVAAASPNVVISQVYGGAGCGTAGCSTYQNDYIELFNRGTGAQSLNGWSVQYASAAGTTWSVTPLPNVSLQPGQYFLIGEGAGANGVSPLPARDVIGTIPMSASSAKVALVNAATAITAGVSCPSGAAIVDLVGYGGANCFEGAAPAPSLTAILSDYRSVGGCKDTDDNSADFLAAPPSARNTASPIDVCPVGLALSINNVSKNESTGSQTFDFTVSLTGPAGPGGVTFDIATADYTATTADNDYLAQTLTGQTIAEGASSSTFTVTTNGDSAFEFNETFFVNLTNVTGATVFDGQGAGTLINDDPNNCGDPYTPIYQIQGSGPSAPTPGFTLTEGTVVADFEGLAAASGFYIQDPAGDGNDATSDGVFVFTGAGNLASVGDRVRVAGYTRERFNQTAITGGLDDTTAVTSVLLCSTGNSLPEAVSVTLPFPNATFPERYEGMLVNLPQSLVISEYFNYDRFGEIVLAQPLPGETRPFSGTAIDAPGDAANARTAANLLSRITLDDVQSAQNPPVLRHPNGNPFSLTNYFRGGDTVTNTVGVMGYDFGVYRILPTGPATYTPANPRPAAPNDPGGRITVAAQNTLNFFLTLDTTTSDTGPGPCGANQNLDCRGADSDQPLEFTRQRDKLLATLSGLDADVIGLNELENTPGVDPLGDPTRGLVAGLNDISGAGTYASINTGIIGTDAIRVGLIYRPAAVTPIGGYAMLDSSVDPRFIDTKSRPVLAQTFEENATGARFTVAVNHLKSKGSSCTDVGDPDLGDGQGNCSGTRTLAAAALVDWLATDPTGSGDPDFLIIGDLNSYAMESPIRAIKVGPDDALGTGDDYTNLVNQYLGTYAYSYTFDGQAGYLDHALSSATLTGQVSGVAEWHINADEADVLDYDTSFKPSAQDDLYEAGPYRSSDHDGVIVGLDLTATQTPAAITINAGDNQSAAVTTDFGTQLDLTVRDGDGNPIADAEVTFAGPLTGAAASIAGTGPFLTDDSGNLVVTATANAVAGGPYELVATAGSATASFHLTNQAGAPATVTINAGDDQATTINTAFPTQLDLTVTDSNGNPVPGVTVTFAGPVAGASASIATAGPYTTDDDGNLVVTAQANGAAGAYQLVATAGGATATFDLTNLVGAPATIAINAGDDQQTLVNTDFQTPLDLTILDAGGNPVPNATVNFAGPASGASASIVETGPYTTDGNGNLVVTAHANAIAGAYQLVATVGAASAGFDLTNRPLPTVKLSAGATCSTFSDGTASTLSEVTYSVKKGKISALSVGTFSYWIAVTAVAGTNTLSVDQSITTGNFARLFAVAAASNVYRSSCGGGVKSTFTQTTTAAATGTVTVTFTAPTAGTYFVNVKLTTGELKGEAPPTPGTVHFVFSTTGIGGSARALDLSAQ